MNKRTIEILARIGVLEGELNKLRQELAKTKPGMVQHVFDSVSQEYGVSEARLKGRDRGMQACKARAIVCAIFQRGMGLSPKKIGEVMGGTKRETVFYRLRSVDRWFLYPEERSRFDRICNQVGVKA